MKNFHQNLLIVLALCLCALCAWQWYGETVERNQMDELKQTANKNLALIQDYTNSIQMMQLEIEQMDGHITELKNTVKTNDDTILQQKRDLNQSEAQNDELTNEIVQYKQSVDTLEAKLKDAYDGLQKQNDAIKELAAQRDEFVKKYNDLVIDRNNVVSNYNALAAQFAKLQSSGGK
jgi:chromosome segregation ATPase